VSPKPIAIRVLLVSLVTVPVVAVAITWFAGEKLTTGRRTELERFGPVSDFSLTDDGEKPVRLADLRGKVWVASFILTRCAGACPVMTHHLGQLQGQLPVRDDLRLVSISVDPEHDTPAVLAAYAARNKADRTRWWFLTGERQQIYRLARTAFNLTVDDTAGTAEEPVLHSTKFVLVDRNGQIRGYYDGLETVGQEQLVRDVRRLLAEKS
jgi:cytochrome oxidase Cu insertion factor (SCO1/SenC/PrrC family)